MPNVQLARVPGLDPQLLQHLAANGFASGRDLLFSNTVDLMELLNLTQHQTLQLQQVVSAHICPPGTPALALRQIQRVALPTMLPTLDACMRQGLPAGSVTELVGPAGVGKSQMCFQLSLLCAAPAACAGLGSAVLYVDTERKFSSSRFAEMACTRFSQTMAESSALDATLQRVMLISPTSSEQLVHCLETLEAGIIQHHACLVIVDSIASLARAEYYGGGGGAGHGRTIMDRQEMLGTVAARLKYLAESFQIPIVVTNQVTTRMTGQAAAHGFQQQQQDGQDGGGRGYLTAALGTKWAHCVNVRIILERLAGKRYLKVAKSAATANVALEYAVTAQGVEEVIGAEIPEQLNTSDVLAMPIVNEVEYRM